MSNPGSSSPPPPSTTLPPNSHGEEDGYILGLPFKWYIFVAIVVGGAVLFFLCLTAIACTCCRRKAKKKSALASLQSRQHSKDNDYLQQSVPLDDHDVEKGQGRKGGNRDSKLMFNVHEALTSSLERSMVSYMIESDRMGLEEVIGAGQFGVVYRGTLKDNETGAIKKVAVKTLQGEDCSKDEVQKFLDEVMRMKSFAHDHVLTILGICIQENQPYAILPFMENGDLKSYLQEKNRNFTIRDLLEFGRQTAEGMRYLASQSFVHRDLAARNCMVDEKGMVKIADFGLSRDLFMSDYYKMQDLNTPLPVKWMALESIKQQKFSEKSDVWSFGVLLWEIMTRGKNPYPGLTNVKVISHVSEGKRLAKPPYTPDEIYNVMMSCWCERPEDRPAFGDLELRVHEMLYGAGIEGKYKKLVATPAKNKITEVGYYNEKDKKGKGKKKKR